MHTPAWPEPPEISDTPGGVMVPAVTGEATRIIDPVARPVPMYAASGGVGIPAVSTPRVTTPTPDPGVLALHAELREEARVRQRQADDALSRQRRTDDALSSMMQMMLELKNQISTAVVSPPAALVTREAPAIAAPPATMSAGAGPSSHLTLGPCPPQPDFSSPMRVTSGLDPLVSTPASLHATSAYAPVAHGPPPGIPTMPTGTTPAALPTVPPKPILPGAPAMAPGYPISPMQVPDMRWHQAGDPQQTSLHLKGRLKRALSCI